MKIRNNQQGIGAVLLIISITIVMGAVGYAAYRVGKSSQSSSNVSSSSQNTGSESPAAVQPQSDNEQITSVLEAEACTEPPATTLRAGEIKVYKEFASAKFNCLESEEAGGPGAIMILKKVDGKWTAIGPTHGCGRFDPQYGITDEVFNNLYPSPEFDYCRE